ncbi:NTP transferase domain-containing protein, partial [uncultured Bilophila sp.]
MADSPRLPAVVLAAGFSRRMGRCKLTLPLDGEPLVRRVVRAALEAGLAPVFVTLRPDASPDLRAALSGFDDRVVLVPAPEAHRGQAESLKAGIRSVMASAPAYTRGGASTEYGSVTTRASAPDACGPENGTPPDPAQGHAAPVPPQPLPEGCLPASDGPTGSDAFPRSDGL